MHPPLTILMRYCKRPFTVTTSKGLSFVIPKAGPWCTSLRGSRGSLVTADARAFRRCARALYTPVNLYYSCCHEA